MTSYFLRNLVPRKEQSQGHRTLVQALRALTWAQWCLFGTGWLSWFCDSLDFFSISVSVNQLSTTFDNRPTHEITTAITLTLLVRPIGAAIFGILSDRYGRKWPLVVNLVLVSILELGTGFVSNFHSFLGIRTLFGVGMGGIWGLASSTAIENLPVELRGLASGIIQEGYTCGYLIASILNLFLVPHVKAGWRSLFWAAAGISLFAAVVRALLPESEVFLRAKRADIASGNTTKNKTRIFLRQLKKLFTMHWARCIYAVLFMIGFTFLPHSTQDLYPTYMQNAKGFSSHAATVATIIGNCGTIAGGVASGMLSQYIGRRLTIIIFVVLAGAFIPLWTSPTSFSALSAGAFCIQFGAGAFGVVPIHLAEMSPPGFRATFPGVTYQMGNMVSSAAAQIEATAGDRLRIKLNGKDVPDYAKVQGIFVGVIVVYLVIVTILGPEDHSSPIEKHKTAFQEDEDPQDTQGADSADVKGSDASVEDKCSDGV